MSSQLMGNYLSNSTDGWACYARDKKGSYMAPIWEAVDQHEAVGKFKHDVFAYALAEKSHSVYKTMYLYDGKIRMAKVSKSIDNHGDRLNMMFLDDEFAVYFDGKDELLSNRDDVWLKNRFEKNYVAVPANRLSERKWLDLAR